MLNFATSDMWSDGKEELGSSPSPISSKVGISATPTALAVLGLKKMKSMVSFLIEVTASSPGVPLFWKR